MVIDNVPRGGIALIINTIENTLLTLLKKTSVSPKTKNSLDIPLIGVIPQSS